MKSVYAILLTSMLLVPVGSANAADTVDVNIQVIKASRAQKGYEGSARRYRKQLGSMGFVGAKTIDVVTANARAVGSSVELRFKDGQPGKERTIRVRVLQSSASATKLRIEVPSYKFSTETTHSGGGAFLAIIPKDDLVLAVRPGR